jgi:Predicted membrane protein
MSEEAFILCCDLFGTMVFAITGAVKGVRIRLDLLGVLVFAVTVGCGGGMVRDMLLGATPVAAFQNGYYVGLCLFAGLIVFLMAPKVVGRWKIIIYADAIGLGIFTAIGVQKAASLGVGIVGQVTCGVLTAVGGGVLRDVFAREVPMVLTSDFYATASIIGALVYCYLETTAISSNIAFYICFAVVFLLRVLAIRCKIKLPVARMAGEMKKPGQK